MELKKRTYQNNTDVTRVIVPVMIMSLQKKKLYRAVSTMDRIGLPLPCFKFVGLTDAVNKYITFIE